jgi:hypothetical protein
MTKHKKSFSALLVILLGLALIALAISAVALDNREELRLKQQAEMLAQRASLSTAATLGTAEQPALKSAQGEHPSFSAMAPLSEELQAELAAKLAEEAALEAAIEAKRADEMARGAEKAPVPEALGRASISTILPEKKPYTGHPNIPHPDDERVGGDDISTAVVIPSVPYSDAGSTASFVDDYDEICPYNATGSPDVVYSYSPAADVEVTISLCNDATAYDTKLYVYENAVGNVVACNDDFCATASFPSEYVS